MKARRFQRVAQNQVHHPF